MKKVLILEDDVRLNETLNSLLSVKFKVHSATTLKEATKLVATNHFDAVVSDFLLEDGDGFGVLNLLNTLQSRPKAIFITAFAEKDMAIKLLNLKIDGFLEKPFKFSEMTELLERELMSEPSDKGCSLVLIPSKKTIESGNVSIVLTDVEFKLLSYLIAQKNRWITREELIEYVWGGATNSRNTLDTHLSNLKRKVPNFKNDLHILRGRGFSFSPRS